MWRYDPHHPKRLVGFSSASFLHHPHLGLERLANSKKSWGQILDVLQQSIEQNQVEVGPRATIGS